MKRGIDASSSSIPIRKLTAAEAVAIRGATPGDTTPVDNHRDHRVVATMYEGDQLTGRWLWIKCTCGERLGGSID